ncbi:hypothetical protein FRB96_008477 [Tulasnella sp. 330]|nr:hypothetical protein FRB96_008477 [Tulasnella sp. 330]KAG8884000.1 hypothetical protein FRB97_005444 [Tulasnella sp. 331]KAG8889324.1 hypothetical protein FRB98_004941 [Tulasnella sp. 332]
MSTLLPEEIWSLIIHELGDPPHISAYRLDPKCAGSLAQLCLANRMFNALAVPVLYSRVVITSRSLESFYNTIVLAPRESGKSIDLTNRGKRVRSLAFIGFSEHLSESEIHNVGPTILALRSSLIRLFLDLNFHYGVLHSPSADVTIQHALRSLSVIEELCLRDGQAPLSWSPAWKTLRRMAVAMMDIRPYLFIKLAEKESLEVCIAAWPHYIHLDPEVFNLRDVARGDWVTEGRSQEFVMTVTGPDDWVSRCCLQTLQDRPYSSNAPGGAGRGLMTLMEVREINEFSDTLDQDRLDWFVGSVLDGTIWGIGRDTWEVFRERLQKQ